MRPFLVPNSLCRHFFTVCPPRLHPGGTQFIHEDEYLERILSINYVLVLDKNRRKFGGPTEKGFFSFNGLCKASLLNKYICLSPFLRKERIFRKEIQIFGTVK